MKTLRLVSLALFVVSFATASLLAVEASPSAPAKKTKLQVNIQLPSMPERSLNEDSYLIDAFAKNLAKTFKRQGDPREIVRLRQGVRAQPDAPLLTLQLVEWRSTIPGEMHCAFNALYTDGGQQQDFGRIFGTEVIGSDYEEAMNAAAKAALKKLCKRLGSDAAVAVQD